MLRAFRASTILIAIATVTAACGGGGAPPTAATAAPAKPSFAAGTAMAEIQNAGKLKAGVRDDAPPFGRKNPTTNKFEGFDVDIVREATKAIFGATDANVDNFIEFVPVVSATRIPSLQENKVDIVAATMTITEARKLEIDFSDIYFKAGQRILVKKDNTTIKEVEDLNGRSFCAAVGSTSLDNVVGNKDKNIVGKAPNAKPLALKSYAECLTALQGGQVDSISTDDAILAGLVLQDANTKIVGRLFSDEPYGLGVKKARTGFQQFLNDLLKKMISDGTWKRLYDKHLRALMGVEKTAP